MSNLLVALPLRQRKPLRICTDIPLWMRYSSHSSSSSSSPSNRSTTPSGITSSTSNHQYFFHALCMHDFESSDPVHLSFQKDEVLIIIQQEHSGWWAAMRPQGDRIGWIPSSFVLPLDRGKTAEYPDETPWPHESLSDSPLSAVHDPWVPVSEDYRVLSFQLVTPTDPTLYKGYFDDRVQHHNCESFLRPSNGEKRSDMRDVCVPAMLDSPSPHMAQRPALPQSPLSSELGALQPTRSTNPPLLDAESYHLRPCAVDDQIPFLCLTTSDAIAPELISNMDIGESLVVFKSVSASQDDPYSEDALSQHFGLPASFHLGTPLSGSPDTSSRSTSHNLWAQTTSFVF